MPELPEVEVTRRSFAGQITGARILSANLGKPLRWPLSAPPATLIGHVVAAVRRRGKYLLLDIDDGRLLLIHLGMSGSLRFFQTCPPAGKHDHFDLVTSRGTLRLHDPRRFGAVVLTPGEQSDAAQRLLGRLGVEPLGDGFDLVSFQAGLRQRNAPVKQVLLAGELVVGVGNIYASEALFQAGIRPTRKACRIGSESSARLHAAIRSVLASAVELGGSTLKDFSSASGEAGHFQLSACVYGREGLPCVRCGRPVRKMLQGQRSTYFCAACQR